MATSDGDGVGEQYHVITAPPVFTVLTVVSYADEPEYREYEVSSGELPLFLEEMADPQHGETVVTVEQGGVDDDERRQLAEQY